MEKIPSEILTSILEQLDTKNLIGIINTNNIFNFIIKYIISKRMINSTIKLFIHTLYYKDNTQEVIAELLIGNTNKINIISDNLNMIETSITNINHDCFGYPKLIDILNNQLSIRVARGYTSYLYPYVPELLYLKDKSYQVINGLTLRSSEWPDGYKKTYVIKPNYKIGKVSSNIKKIKKKVVFKTKYYT